MRKTLRPLLVLLGSLAVLLALAGCASFASISFGPRGGGGRAQPKGDTVVITGTVTQNGNQFQPEDRAGTGVYRFVGLQKSEAESLKRLEGRVVSVRLRIVSASSAKAKNAQLVEIVS